MIPRRLVDAVPPRCRPEAVKVNSVEIPEASIIAGTWSTVKAPGAAGPRLKSQSNSQDHQPVSQDQMRQSQAGNLSAENEVHLDPPANFKVTGYVAELPAYRTGVSATQQRKSC